MAFPTRKEIRLKNYDYSTPGAYFITICTHQKRSILSMICRGDPCGRPYSRYGRWRVKVDFRQSLPGGRFAGKALAALLLRAHHPQ